MKLSEEVKTILTITKHTRLIQMLLGKIASELELRAQMHDLSKWNLDEFEGFTEINTVLRNYKFGSEEYRNSLKDNKVIELHFSRNSHHPEFFPNGIKDMSLVDFIEMVVDWKAANMSYGDTSWQDAVNVQIKRFNMTPEQVFLVELIAEELDYR